MTIKDAFPLFYQNSTFKLDGRFEQAFFYEADSLETAMDLFRESLQDCSGDDDKESNLSFAICKDLIAFPQRPPSTRLLGDYVKFQVCIIMMNITGFKRLFHPQFHWIASSVATSVDEDAVREVKGGWILDFSESDIPYIKANFKIDFIQWTCQFFYYMRTMGGHQELTAFYIDSLLNTLFRLVNRAYFYPGLDVALGQLLTWASNAKFSAIKENAAKAKMFLYETEGYPEEWRKNIEFGFACTGYELTHKSQQEWIKLAMTRELGGHERMQLTAIKYEKSSKDAIASLPEIMASINEYHTYLYKTFKKNQLLNYELSRVYSLLMPVILILLTDGEVAAANQIIGHYFRIIDKKLIAPTNVIITQGTIDGVQYARQGKVLYSHESPFKHAQELMKLSNSFFGWTGVMKDDLTFIPERPPRGEGVPNPKYGPELEKLIVKFYGFDQPELLAFIKETSGYFLLGNYQLPLQPLVVKYGQFALPTIQSFKKPFNARPIKSVFMWQGDSTSSEMECNAVQRLFECKGITVFRLNWYEATKDQFLNAYNDNYDLVWVSGHGEFDHFRPHLSSLVLYQDFSDTESKNVSINYDEITEVTNSNDSRRLLVLNLCDGATTTLDNSPAAIGLGAKMINEFQSLISHQWPIDPFSGLIFGILIADALANGENYLQAYTQSVSTFIQGKAAVVEKASVLFPDEELPEIIERNTAVDFENLFFYGSLMYLE